MMQTRVYRSGKPGLPSLRTAVPGISLRYPLLGTDGDGPRSSMTFHNIKPWEFAACLAVLGASAGAVSFLIFRKRPSAEELERTRRLFLVQSGRIVDGMLLDVCEVEAHNGRHATGRMLTMLLFNYRIGGVDYECSQDVTDMAELVDAAQVRLGFPCSVRYQPGNPQNSIVVAEKWSGLRLGLPPSTSMKTPTPSTSATSAPAAADPRRAQHLVVQSRNSDLC